MPFLNELANIDWQQILTCSQDINSVVQYWTNMISLLIEKHEPLRERRVSDKFTPWLTADIKNMFRTHDRLKAAAINSKSIFQKNVPPDTDLFEKVYCKLTFLNRIFRLTDSLLIKNYSEIVIPTIFSHRKRLWTSLASHYLIFLRIFLQRYICILSTEYTEYFLESKDRDSWGNLADENNRLSAERVVQTFANLVKEVVDEMNRENQPYFN